VHIGNEEAAHEMRKSCTRRLSNLASWVHIGVSGVADLGKTKRGQGVEVEVKMWSEHVRIVASLI
jgi:hypothetical protein